MAKSSFYEDISKPDDILIGSERSFGIVFAVVFSIIGLFPLWSAAPVQLWGLIIAAVFLVLAFAWPKALRPLNKIWFQFGLVLHKIVNPIIMGLIFFGCVMPIGLLLRLFGKKPLALEFDAHVNSYWIHRPSPSPEPNSMKRQF